MSTMIEKTLIEKKAVTQVPIDDLLARRWSDRAFDAARPLRRDQVLALLEAARWAPSCFGDQPWRYIVCDRTANTTAWERALDCLADGNRSWAANAPLLLLALADTEFHGREGANPWGGYDSGAASQNLCLQATSMGLMTHQMGGFDAGRAREVFAVPARYVPMAMIAVGYQLPDDSLDEAQQARRQEPRMRRPLGELFFDGYWDRAYD